MKGEAYTIRVRLDAGTFRRFCRFDTLRLRKKWVRPAVFALILVAFAVVALLTRREQSGLIAAVLLAVGLGLPLVYFGSFFSQVNLQVARHNLDKPRPVYTVCLDGNGIRVTNDQREEAPLEVSWKDAQAAFRAKGCIYLYINAQRAFLLPEGQCDADAVWAFLKRNMAERCADRRWKV